MSNPSLTHLFEESCDPHAYIPRRASEEVLKCLSSLIRDSEPVLVLHGPAGIGKSMLLQVLRERFEGERRTAFVSIGENPEPELCQRLIEALSEPAAADPAKALIRTAVDGPIPLLLLVDHPDLAPIASSLQLAAVATSAAPHITVVFAISDEMGADQFARALSVEASVTTLRFSQAMDPKEASAYVRLRLARTDLPAAVRNRLDDRAMRWLTEGAQAGLPREINRRASELLRSFEEDGEAALRVSIAASDSIAAEDAERQPAAPRVVDPSSHPASTPTDTQATAFPMRSGDARDKGPAVPVGGGSLGGMLLRSGAGEKPNFEMNLELGRSLSSGLLEHTANRPSNRDGQPVDPADLAAGHVATHEEAHAGSRNGAWIASFVLVLAIISVYLASRTAPPGDESTTPNESLARLETTDAPSGDDPSIGRRTPTDTRPDTASSANLGTGIDDAGVPEDSALAKSRPSLVDGPMGDAAILAVEASVKRKAEVAPATEPEPAKPTRPPAARQRASTKPAAKTPIVLPARTSGGGTTQPNSYVRISIDVEPGAKITVDGEPIGVAPFADVFVEMGTHTFIAEMPDGILVEQLVDVQAGTDVVEF